MCLQPYRSPLYRFQINNILSGWGEQCTNGHEYRQYFTYTVCCSTENTKKRTAFITLTSVLRKICYLCGKIKVLDKCPCNGKTFDIICKIINT